jgi:hypothetical protein
MPVKSKGPQTDYGDFQASRKKADDGWRSGYCYKGGLGNVAIALNTEYPQFGKYVLETEIWGGNHEWGDGYVYTLQFSNDLEALEWELYQWKRMHEK